MKNLFPVFVVGLAFSTALFALSARAVEYYEFEVYPYQTAAQGELELENTSSLSNGTSYGQGDIFRTSVEASYGAWENIEFAAYADFTKDPAHGNTFRYAGTRFRGRTSFFEKGELPLDFGAYFEISFPRFSEDLDSVENMEFEFRPIIEKDFGRFSLDLNPIVEVELQTADDGFKELVGSVSYAAGVAYRATEWFRPHLDFHGDLWTSEQKAQYIMPNLDFKPLHNFTITVGMGFGLTQQSERLIAISHLEYEFY